jgi:NADH:ubiquinone oxidoreductase subunit H
MGGVAFLTLLERKILGLAQIRLGPNKITNRGYFQPLVDGVKLLFKEFYHVKITQRFLFLLGPMLLLRTFLLTWGLILPWGLSRNLRAHYLVIILFLTIGVSPYAVILTGWSSTSPFSKLGRLRGMLQRLSFEVALVLVMFVLLFLYASLAVRNENLLRVELILWAILWGFLVLLERNRSPFDLLEAERELIRGFNVEARSPPFIFIFLREYGMLLTLGLITPSLILGTPTLNPWLSGRVVGGALFMRRCFPRMRYDSLMRVMWQGVLPLALVAVAILAMGKLEGGV